MAAKYDLIKNPVHIFDAPLDLIYSLRERQLEDGSDSQAHADPNDKPKEQLEASDDNRTTSATSCSMCNVQNDSVQEQREHVRSDLHKFNLKRKMNKQSPITEAEFEQIVEDLNDNVSVSGSESEDSDNEDGPLAQLLRKHVNAAPQVVVQNGSGENENAVRAEGGPIKWFTSNLVQKDSLVGVYRVMFSDTKSDHGNMVKIMENRREKVGKYKGPHIAMFMIGGGHFAGMLIHVLLGESKHGQKKTQIICSKTFHRYTTRRKQGGAQSTNDAAKGAAHSAGSSLRRSNEAALEHEIHELLKDWREPIDEASLIFVRASGSNNRKVLFNWEDSPLKANDLRLRGIPMTTRRPTQNELMRIYFELTRFKIQRYNQSEDLAKLAKKVLSLYTPEEPKPRPAKPTPTDEVSKRNKENADHSSTLCGLIRRGKAPHMLQYLQANDLNGNFEIYPPNYHAPTLLHYASSINARGIINALIIRGQGDPTLKNSEGKTPFELAGERSTRDAFRIARSDAQYVEPPLNIDWDAAKVPSPLTAKEVEERNAKEKEDAEANARAGQLRSFGVLRPTISPTYHLPAEEWPATPANPEQEAVIAGHVYRGTGRRVATEAERRAHAARQRQEEERGMSDEARMKLQRERRARAAEERMRKLKAEDAGGYAGDSLI